MVVESAARIRQAAVVLVCLTVLSGPPTIGLAEAGTTPLTVTTRSGKSESWHSQLRGKRRTLVVFMATWCRVCARKQPQMLRWASNNRRSTQTIFLFSGSPPAEVLELAKERKIPASLVRVLVDRHGAIAKHYAVTLSPLYVLFRPDGSIKGRYLSIPKIPK